MDVPSCETLRFVIGNASQLSGYAILYYDYLLTLPGEIENYWCTGSHTWASIVFLVNRYTAVLGHIPLLYFTFQDPCKTENIAILVRSYYYILVTVSGVMTQVLLIMRVYAMYYRNKWVLCVVVSELTAAICIACWSLSRLVPGVDMTETESHARFRAEAVAFSGFLVIDFTIFVLTIACSIRLWTRKEPFLHRLLTDGLLYYCVICNVALLNIIVLLLVNPRIDLSTPVFTYVLIVVMASRLMINLRDPVLHRSDDGDETDHDTPPHAGCVSTVVLLDTFSSIVETPLESENLTLPGVEPDLERMRRNALESIRHKTSSNL